MRCLLSAVRITGAVRVLPGINAAEGRWKSTFRLPPEAVQAVPSAASCGGAASRVGWGDVQGQRKLQKGVVCVCVIWEEDVLFQQMSTSLICCLQAGRSLGCDGVQYWEERHEGTIPRGFWMSLNFWGAFQDADCCVSCPHIAVTSCIAGPHPPGAKVAPL